MNGSMMRSRLPALHLPGLALAVLLAAALPGCADETKPADPNARTAAAAPKPEARPARVFTNKDLEKYHSARSTGMVVVDTEALQRAKAEGAKPPEEALYPDEKARRMADLEQQIKEAQAQAADLDKRLAFMANPYLPPPQLTPEQVQAMKGMSQKEAYQSIQAEKAALVERIAGLQGDYDKLVLTPTQPRAGAAAPAPDAGAPPQP